ncbi:glycosyltransferase family 2 protein [Vibrio cholerae]|uniref:Glycosyl transferase family 2 n=1 Tax=Vibrio paracholerae TaxID=650003 RepID=A0ABD7FYC6_9VIBR|nr:glycosyltransferase [Vibrio paracholerae]RBM71555.1 glycosyl transferase family 2 [Vibrio paracholerae]HDL9426958.1 glycosyltransferase [Vibrio cholerae]
MPKVVNDTNDLVSVILPVYNCERFVGLAIESILNQTYKNIELIVIDDGSTDNSFKIVNSYSQDLRLVVLSRENKGLVYSLNEAIGIANGKYIARMDADDISMPCRIQKQVDFLVKNRDVAIVGSRTILIDEDGTQIGKCHRPLSNRTVRSYFYYGSPLAHPSIMYNLNLLSKDEIKYIADDYPAEDLGVFLRISKKHKICNIKQPLLKYRVTDSGISNTNRKKQEDKSYQLRLSYFSNGKVNTSFVRSIDSKASFGSYVLRLTFDFAKLFFMNPTVVVVYLKVLRRKILIARRSTN